jgi:hypothetical protein
MIYTHVLGGHHLSYNEGDLSSPVMWSEVLVSPLDGKCDPYSVGVPIRNLLSITQVCRQTYSECALMFFDLNDFGIDDDLMDHFLDTQDY